jgi:glutamate/tyrosine decarboxylase-like PLP-dependent enzyme
VGGFALSPMATEIERQTIRWIAELIGFPVEGGGLLVSGGNMANFVGFLAARTAKVPWPIREEGFTEKRPKLLVYCAKATHTWIEKAADLFGLGTQAIRWIAMNADQQMEVEAFEQQILADREAGHLPFLVVGTAGTVSTGAVDPLPSIAAICRKHDLWFHVDGAYGAPAAVLPEASDFLKGLKEADSVALDPHKWLYSPLEAGCTLVRDPKTLTDTFSFHPEYYNFTGSTADPEVNFYEYGPQNSRGFRALKVWMALRHIGKAGYVQMIRDDIALSRALFTLAAEHPQLQAISQHLSITTFRFVPDDLIVGSTESEEYLNQLNKALLDRLQAGGEAFLSNAVIEGKYCLRACIVNFRTTLEDIRALPEIVVRIGKEVDKEMRHTTYKS